MSYHHTFAFGRATTDAKVIDGKKDKQFATFSIAVNSFLGEERGTETTYYECLVFNKKQIEIVGENIKKGDLILAEGPQSVSAYISNKEEAKPSIKLLVNSFYMFKDVSKPKQPLQESEDK